MYLTIPQFLFPLLVLSGSAFAQKQCLPRLNPDPYFTEGKLHWYHNKGGDFVTDPENSRRTVYEATIENGDEARLGGPIFDYKDGANQEVTFKARGTPSVQGRSGCTFNFFDSYQSDYFVYGVSLEFFPGQESASNEWKFQWKPRPDHNALVVVFFCDGPKTVIDIEMLIINALDFPLGPCPPEERPESASPTPTPTPTPASSVESLSETLSSVVSSDSHTSSPAPQTPGTPTPTSSASQTLESSSSAASSDSASSVSSAQPHESGSLTDTSTTVDTHSSSKLSESLSTGTTEPTTTGTETRVSGSLTGSETISPTKTQTASIVSSATSTEATITPTASPPKKATSTIYSTEILTITSCPPEVPDCPASDHSVYISTRTIEVGTSIYPEPEPTDTSSPASEVHTRLSTSTIYSTEIKTVTECPPAVPDCPASDRTVHIATSTVVVGTTICPEPDVPHPTGSSVVTTSSPATPSTTGLLTSTIYSTEIKTITECPPYVPDCPASDRTTHVATETIVVGTTICPEPEVPHPTGSSVPEPSPSTIYSTEIKTITECPPSVPDCPASDRTTHVATSTIVIGTATRSEPYSHPTPTSHGREEPTHFVTPVSYPHHEPPKTGVERPTGSVHPQPYPHPEGPSKGGDQPTPQPYPHPEQPSKGGDQPTPKPYPHPEQPSKGGVHPTGFVTPKPHPPPGKPDEQPTHFVTPVSYLHHEPPKTGVERPTGSVHPQPYPHPEGPSKGGDQPTPQPYPHPEQPSKGGDQPTPKPYPHPEQPSKGGVHPTGFVTPKPHPPPGKPDEQPTSFVTHPGSPAQPSGRPSATPPAFEGKAASTQFASSLLTMAILAIALSFSIWN